MFTFGSILRSAGDTKTPMKVSLWINLLHIVFDYFLIFGVYHFKEFSIAGAVWATVIVRILGSIALFLSIKKSKLSFSLFKKSAFSQKENIRSLLQLSTPAAIERLIMRFEPSIFPFGFKSNLDTLKIKQRCNSLIYKKE